MRELRRVTLILVAVSQMVFAIREDGQLLLMARIIAITVAVYFVLRMSERAPR